MNYITTPKKHITTRKLYNDAKPYNHAEKKPYNHAKVILLRGQCVWKTIIRLGLGKNADTITKYKQQQQ